MAIDKNSAEYLFGQINQRLESGGRQINELTAGMAEVKEALQAFPCADQEGRLNAVEEWRKSINGKAQAAEQLRVRGAISLKSGIIIGVSSAAVSTALALVVSAVMAPPV